MRNYLSIQDHQEEMYEYDQALFRMLLNQYKDVHVLINQLLQQVFLAEKNKNIDFHVDHRDSRNFAVMTLAVDF